MAHNVTDWAYLFDIHFVEKYVLVTIADDADKFGTSRYLGGLKRISTQTNLSVRQIRRSLRKLEAWKLIKIYPQSRPNGSDKHHVFNCQITIDPRGWTPPVATPEATKRRSDIRPVSDEGYYVNKADFNEAMKAALGKKIDPSHFQNWIAPDSTKFSTVHKQEITVHTKSLIFADFLHDYQDLILETAKELQPSIKKIHFDLPEPEKS